MKCVFVKKILLFSLLALPVLAFAGSGGTVGTPAFDAFNQTLLSWTQGALGQGLAVTMLLMGGAMAVAKNTPMPALTGVAGAAFINWGPAIIMSMTAAQGNFQAASTPEPAVAASTVTAASVQGASGAATLAASAPKVTAPASVASQDAAASAPASLSGQSAAEKLLAQTNAPRETPAEVLKLTSSVTSHVDALPHTVPVPTAPHTVHHVPVKSVSSSDLTKWLGVAGFGVIVSILALLVFLSMRRKSKDTGYTPSPAPGAASAFTDPHGFKRENRTPRFNP